MYCTTNTCTIMTRMGTLEHNKRKMHTELCLLRGNLEIRTRSQSNVSISPAGFSREIGNILYHNLNTIGYDN